MSAIERLPKHGAGWREVPIPPRMAATLDPDQLVSIWQRGKLRVVSELAQAELPDGSGEVGPQWFVSVSSQGGRPSAAQVERALRDFNMVGAEEDNHLPGISRQFWLPVDPARRVGCECKATEETVVEPDGFTWTNPLLGEGECRGCEYEAGLGQLVGKRCPIHGGEAVAP